VTPTNPVVYAIVGVVLLGTVVASIVPALRAAKVDPNVPLKAE
jgi:ABC-type lipoprotein release transport system permease subunit